MSVPFRDKRFLATALVLSFLLSSVAPAGAVYVRRFTTIANGALTFTGNTLGLSKAAGQLQPGTLDSIGGFIDSLEPALTFNGFPAGTTGDFTHDSSAAMLRLPPGAVVLHAELVWGGTYHSINAFDVSSSYNKAVTFVTPGGAVNSIAPDPATSQQVTRASADAYYVRSNDVTNIVAAAGAGSYTVGGVAAVLDPADDNSNTAGWTLEVAYGLASLPTRSLTLFVGAEGSGAAPAAVSGFCTPTSAQQSGRIVVSALEGDPNKGGDQLLFGATAANNALSGPNNAPGNFFAGQINDDNGNLDTSGTFGTRNNSPTAVGLGTRQGYDLTNLDVSPYLASTQTTAFAQGTTTGDFYVIDAIGLQVNVGAPSFIKNVKSVDKPTTHVGDVLTYTITFDNTAGTADASNVTLRDAVPAGTTFVANSFKFNGTTVAGADPNAGINVGTVPAKSSASSTFSVTVNSVPAAPARAAYDNSASFTYQFRSCAGQPIENGSITTNTVETTIAQLGVTKTVSPAGPALATQTLTYSIATQNTGLAPSSATTLADPIPAGTTYVPGSTTLNGTAVADVGGAMPYAAGSTIQSGGAAPGTIVAGATATVAYRVKINATPGTASIVNTASVDPDGSGPAGPITAQVTTPLVSTLLTVSKTVRNVTTGTAPSVANLGSPGDVLEYALTYANNTQQSITGIVLDDSTASTTSFVSATCTPTPLPASLTSCTVSQAPAVGTFGLVRYTFGGSLAPGSSGVLLLRVTIK